MSDYTRVKRPDRQLYRHPKYDAADYSCKNPKAISQTVSVSDNKLSYPEKFSHLRSNPERYQKFVDRKDDYVYGSRSGYKFKSHGTEAIRSNRNRPSESFYAYPKSNIHTANKSEQRNFNREDNRGLHMASEVAQSGPSVNKSEKHGGLIRIPKDVDIFHSSNEEKDSISNSRYLKRESAQSKPVVVVRPSFPISQQSHLDSNDSQHLTTNGSRNDTSPQSNLVNASTSIPTTLSSMSWTDAAKLAFQEFFRTSQIDSYDVPRNDFSAALCNDTRTSAIAAHTNTPSSYLPPYVTIQAPNETISSVMQQIVQLDATLSALLIPPGLCAQTMPLLEPLPCNPVDGVKWTEPEELFLRWWGTVRRLRERLFVLFEDVILSDLDFCNMAHVEQGMWKSVFYTILESLRSWIKNPATTRLITQTAENKEVSKLVSLIQSICLNEVIDSGLRKLGTLLDQIQKLHNIQLAPLLSDGRPPPETRSRTRHLVYLSAQKLMLFLGDLARYRETLLGEHNFGKARSWYQKAQLLIPKNGRSYNQLAVLAVYTSRHLDAVCYYMRTLAASNPFSTASQSLVALFNEIRPRAENMIKQYQHPRSETPNSNRAELGTHDTRFKRVEIWIHPIDGQTTVLQGGRQLAHVNKWTIARIPEPELVDNEDEEDEAALAEAEEYANLSLIELSKQFGLAFIHAHGKLYTKIGMETFPEVASLALQALSGLLAQKPCPLSAERLCQLFVINMFDVDRAATMTTQSSSLTNPTKSQLHDNEHSKSSGSVNLPRLAEVETLRSVHHDHAARFALDMFSLVCRRAAQLFQEVSDEPDSPLPPDTRILLSALRLWSEWMVLHPEHWLPPPNHRDPTLRPHLDDWQLVAGLCTQASDWLSRTSERPDYQELTPTLSLINRLKGNLDGDKDEEEDNEAKQHLKDEIFKVAYLNEETFVAGFKPMLDLTPKMYRYTGDWDPETVADFVRIEKLVLFGDYLCGIEPPVLNYTIEKGVYESVMQRESSERVRTVTSATARQSTSVEENLQANNLHSRTELSDAPNRPNKNEPSCHLESDNNIEDIVALQRQRALLQRQLEEETRLADWRRNAIKQAASGGQRAMEIEVRPIYLLPDTNCYIDWLDGIVTLAQKCSNYTVLVPIVVVNELDTLSRYGGSGSGSSGSDNHGELDGGGVTRAGLIQERAKNAINYLEYEFAHRNSRLRALTARGSLMETIAYRNEINGGRGPGQTNDDVILTCCHHFCKADANRIQLRNLGHSDGMHTQGDSTIQPMRLLREVVLLTSDRNLRLKAVSVNIPARPLRTFVNWSRLPLGTVSNLINDTGAYNSKQENDFPKPQPRGQWKQPLKH